MACGTCRWTWGLAACGLLLLGGCGWVPQQRFAAAEVQNSTLVEQNRAQLAEIENLRAHARDVEQQLHDSERELALLEEQAGLDRKQLALVKQQKQGGAGPLSESLRRRFESLSKQLPELVFDAELGLSKLAPDVLFDSADSQLHPDDARRLEKLAYVLSTPDGSELRLLIVGHTDDQGLKRPSRQKFASNWHLSTARALGVAQFLREAGVDEARMGVAGFGAHQPVASNQSPDDRQRNRRVEIFVLAPDTPIVGWTETIPGIYR